MKKLLVLLMVFMLLLLSGCSEKLNFDMPTSDITLHKNYALGEYPINVVSYNSIILSESVDNTSFISNLNKVRYREENYINFDIWGYAYVIMFDEINISIIGNGYFYLDGKLYKITYGNFDFLDSYDWQSLEEN